MKKLISLLLALSLAAMCACTADVSLQPVIENDEEENEIDEKDDENEEADDDNAETSAEKPALTVTVKYTDVDPGEANATAYYCSPMLELRKGSAAADLINNSETIKEIVNGSREGAESIISYALDTPDLAEQYAFFYESGVTYINASESHICYGFADSTYAGGVHPNSAAGYYNLSLETGEILSVSDILNPDNANAKSELEAAIVAALDADDTWTFSSYESIAADFTADKAGNIWRLESDALVLYYSPYMIAPYSSGYIEVKVAYESIPNVIVKEYIPVPDEGNATFNVYDTASDEARAISHRYGTESHAALIANGSASGVTVRSAARGNDVIFYANKFDGCLLYLAEGDTYTITYNGNDSVQITV